jgi:hypothetical protein
MFIVQSGLIRRSLVALSTATVAEVEDDDIDKAISLFLSLSLSLSSPPSISLSHTRRLCGITKKEALSFSPFVCQENSKSATSTATPNAPHLPGNHTVMTGKFTNPNFFPLRPTSSLLVLSRSHRSKLIKIPEITFSPSFLCSTITLPGFSIATL